MGEVDEKGVPFGKYRVVRKVGEGAFGSVHEALLPGPMGFTKRVALKKLRPDLLRDEPRLVRSLINEARIGGMLHHPHIVDILEFEQVDGQYYLAMEFVDGPTLRELIDSSRYLGEPLPRFAVVAWATQICRGLAHAHALCSDDGEPLGLVHRDLKPANVIVDAAGSAKILDFGIAHAASNVRATTATVGARGTPQYMSPEQTTGGAEITAASDIFSVGAVLFEMAVGRSLFEGEFLPAVVHAIVYEEVEDLLDEAEDALPGCRAILQRALHKDPARRYQGASAMADDLLALGREYPVEEDLAAVVSRLTVVVEKTLAGRPAPPTDASQAIDSPRPDLPSPVPVWVLAALVVVLASVLAFVSWNLATASRGDPDPGSLTAAVAELADVEAPDEVQVEVQVEVPGRGATRFDEGRGAPGRGAGRGAVEVPPAVEVPVEVPPDSTREEALPVEVPVEVPADSTADSTAVDFPPPNGGPADGTVSLYSRPWVDIYVDGELIRSDVRLKSHPLDGGRHEIRLVCASAGNREKTYVVDVDGQDLDLGCWDFEAMAPCQV